MPADFAQTLLTSHKGVDLHAATARRVMRDRLSGGDRLADLFRCEFHVFGGGVEAGSAEGPTLIPTLASLLGSGRYYNPNKHRYGHFELDSSFGWAEGSGGPLPAGWPGPAAGGDGAVTPTKFDDLLGGPPPAGHTAVDVAAWARGQSGAVVSGTLWRLVIRGEGASALETGTALAIARSGHEGLLVNPHMECWLVATETAGR